MNKFLPWLPYSTAKLVRLAIFRQIPSMWWANLNKFWWSGKFSSNSPPDGKLLSDLPLSLLHACWNIHVTLVTFTQTSWPVFFAGKGCLDYVLIWETDLYHPLGEFCGNYSGFSLESTRNVVSMMFHSGGADQYKGFQLVYTANSE